MTYIDLFLVFFQVGLFSIGGGLAAIPLIQHQIVTLHGWMNFTEFTDLISIAQMTPGPIAINSATFIGMRIAGFPGAIIATIGCIIPSAIIVTILAYLYKKHSNLRVVQGILSGLKPAIVALIASSGLKILQFSVLGTSDFKINPNSVNYISIGLFLIALFVLRKWKPNPIIAMFGTGIIGGAIYYFNN
ncbi:MAG: chromate transporter [Spirochaetales bacterium]|nr:chromate transporter [Spirochaetales bacterium]